MKTNTVASAELKLNFVDGDNDGRIDQLTRTAQLGENNDFAYQVTLSDLRPSETQPFFARAAFCGNSETKDLLALKGVAIKPLAEYLHQIQIARELPLQVQTRNQAEAYADAGQYERYVEYLADNPLPPFESFIMDPYAEAARQAFLAGLDLNLVHPKVLAAATHEAEQRLKLAIDPDQKKNRDRLLDDAFEAARWAGQTTILGQTQKQWREICELDGIAAKQGVKTPGDFNRLIVQIAEDDGYVFKNKDNSDSSELSSHTQFGPKFNFSTQTQRALQEYLTKLTEHSLNKNLFERLIEFVARAVSSWIHKQIKMAQADQKNPLRAHAPAYWESLHKMFNSLHPAIQMHVRRSYLDTFGSDALEEIDKGWIFDLEYARNQDLFMAHSLNHFAWVQDAMADELLLKELGGTPTESVDWENEIHQIETSSGKTAPENIMAEAEIAAKQHSHHW